jgi:hypothetical protein
MDEKVIKKEEVKVNNWGCFKTITPYLTKLKGVKPMQLENLIFN